MVEPDAYFHADGAHEYTIPIRSVRAKEDAVWTTREEQMGTGEDGDGGLDWGLGRKIKRGERGIGEGMEPKKVCVLVVFWRQGYRSWKMRFRFLVWGVWS